MRKGHALVAGTVTSTSSPPRMCGTAGMGFAAATRSSVISSMALRSASFVASLTALDTLRNSCRPSSESAAAALSSRNSFPKPLPSAKTLDAIAYRTIIVTVPVFGLGIVLGAIWAESAWGRFWAWDPKETVSLITWMLYAAYLHARATAGWRDAKAAWINILGLATMVFNLFFINLVVSGLHSYAGLN